jgi:hypothetical protein
MSPPLAGCRYDVASISAEVAHQKNGNKDTDNFLAHGS